VLSRIPPIVAAQAKTTTRATLEKEASPKQKAYKKSQRINYDFDKTHKIIYP
jgi:hypothetical protein